MFYKNNELKGHDINYHKDGYSTPLGKIMPFNKTINKLNQLELKQLNFKIGNNIELNFEKNIKAIGLIKKVLTKNIDLNLHFISSYRLQHLQPFATIFPTRQDSCCCLLLFTIRNLQCIYILGNVYITYDNLHL